MIIMSCPGFDTKGEDGMSEKTMSPCSFSKETGKRLCVEYEKLQAITKRHRSRRARGKRKPRKKESRRRVRPGHSRKRFDYVTSIGAPCNNNEYLISQRNDDFEETNKLEEKLQEQAQDAFDLQTSSHYVHGGEDKSQTMCKRCEMPHSRHSHSHSHSHRHSDCDNREYYSSDSSSCDYGSHRPHLPTPSPGAFSTGKNCGDSFRDRIYDGDITDEEVYEEFVLKNFEADYTAEQHELREELLKLPRQQLQERCVMLMEKVKNLEEINRVHQLEVEVKRLVEENTQLRRNNSVK